MKFITRICTITVFIFFILQIGAINCCAQESEFIIKLKNGAEIKTNVYVIEEGIVYYRFFGGKNAVGVNKSDVAEIVECIKSIELDPASSKIHPGILAESIAKGMDFEKDLVRYGYAVPEEKEVKKEYRPMCSMEYYKPYPDLEGREWVVVVEGIIKKESDYPEKRFFPVVAQFEDENNKIVLQRILLPPNVLREMEVGDLRDVRVNIPLHMKGKKCVIKRDDYKSK